MFRVDSKTIDLRMEEEYTEVAFLAISRFSTALGSRLKVLRSSTLSDADNQILPAFYEDNYFSLLPGEQKSVTIRCAQADAGPSEPELWVEAGTSLAVRVPQS